MTQLRYGGGGAGSYTLAPVNARSQRRQEVEVLRIVSAFGIVWYHTASVGRDFAYVGLIAFLITSMYFATRHAVAPKSVASRARTLLIPWAIWFLFYGLLNVVRHQDFLPMAHGWGTGILAGTSIHLWYLPFIFFCMVGFDWIRTQVDARVLAVVCVVTAGLLLALSRFWREPSLDLIYPYAQYAHALSGVLIGVFLANCDVLSRRDRVLAVAALLLSIAMFSASLPGVGVPYLLGVAVTALALSPAWKGCIQFDVVWLSECTFGIYLSHIFWLRLIRSSSNIPELALPFVVFAVSAATVWMLKKGAPRVARYVV